MYSEKTLRDCRGRPPVARKQDVQSKFFSISQYIWAQLKTGFVETTQIKEITTAKGA